MKKPNLILEAILNKKFSIALSGYNATEVDQFLDLIIEDYKTYKKTLAVLEQKLIEKTDIIEVRDDEIKRLNFEIDNLKAQLKESTKASQYAILQEIKELKKMNRTAPKNRKNDKNVI